MMEYVENFKKLHMILNLGGVANTLQNRIWIQDGLDKLKEVSEINRMKFNKERQVQCITFGEGKIKCTSIKWETLVWEQFS